MVIPIFVRDIIIRNVYYIMKPRWVIPSASSMFLRTSVTAISQFIAEKILDTMSAPELAVAVPLGIDSICFFVGEIMKLFVGEGSRF
jgi:hypothetical protein